MDSDHLAEIDTFLVNRKEFKDASSKLVECYGLPALSNSFTFVTPKIPESDLDPIEEHIKQSNYEKVHELVD